MCPNPFGNVSSRIDRAKCRELLTLANRLHEAAESLKQSSEALEATCKELKAPESLFSKFDRSVARPKARAKAQKMEYEAREKAREALRLVSRHLKP